MKTLCARRNGVSAQEMVEEMGVSDKTIRRDLETFQRAEFPLVEIVGDFGKERWRIDQGKMQPDLAFTFDEAIALYLGRHLLEPLAGTLFWEASQRAFKKVRAVLGADALACIERFAGVFHQTMVGVSDYTKKSELIDQLMIGIEDRKAVLIAYQSLRATEPITCDVYPYGITCHRGSLYLIGRAPEHEELRHWKVDRIEEAEATQFPFQRPDDFDLSEHLASSFDVFQGNGDAGGLAEGEEGTHDSTTCGLAAVDCGSAGFVKLKANVDVGQSAADLSPVLGMFQPSACPVRLGASGVLLPSVPQSNAPFCLPLQF